MAQPAETTDELLARMAAKYGIATHPAEQPKPQAPAPQPAQQPRQRGIIETLVNRPRQIDSAVDRAVRGYAHGGKIIGPGTPTSDSIPAEVRDTGEEIKVSTGERILSKAQDDYLAAMAKKMGFESLDAMLEQGTGMPVGPTMKGGKRAAAFGMGPDEKVTSPLSGHYRFDPFLVDRIKESLTNFRGRLLEGPSYVPRNENYGNEGRGSIASLATQAATPPAAPTPPGPLGGDRAASEQRQAERQAARDAADNPQSGGGGGGIAAPSVVSRGGVSTINGDGVMDILARESAIRDSMQDTAPRGGIIADTSKNDRAAFDNFLTRTSLQSAIHDARVQNTPRSLASIANLAGVLDKVSDSIPEQELRRDALTQKSAIDQQQADQQGRYQRGTLANQAEENRTRGIVAGAQVQEAADRAETNALTRQAAQFDLNQKQGIANLVKEYMAQGTAPERKKAIEENLRLLQGGSENAKKYNATYEEVPIDPANPIAGVRRVPVFYDEATGIRQGGQQQAPSNINQDQRALAIKNNAKLSYDEKVKQLQELGY